MGVVGASMGLECKKPTLLLGPPFLERERERERAFVRPQLTLCTPYISLSHHGEGCGPKKLQTREWSTRSRGASWKPAPPGLGALQAPSSSWATRQRGAARGVKGTGCTSKWGHTKTPLGFPANAQAQEQASKKDTYLIAVGWDL